MKILLEFDVAATIHLCMFVSVHLGVCMYVYLFISLSIYLYVCAPNFSYPSSKKTSSRAQIHPLTRVTDAIKYK